MRKNLGPRTAEVRAEESDKVEELDPKRMAKSPMLASGVGCSYLRLMLGSVGIEVVLWGLSVIEFTAELVDAMMAVRWVTARQTVRGWDPSLGSVRALTKWPGVCDWPRLPGRTEEKPVAKTQESGIKQHDAVRSQKTALGAPEWHFLLLPGDIININNC